MEYSMQENIDHSRRKGEILRIQWKYENLN